MFKTDIWTFLSHLSSFHAFYNLHNCIMKNLHTEFETDNSYTPKLLKRAIRYIQTYGRTDPNYENSYAF